MPQLSQPEIGSLRSPARADAAAATNVAAGPERARTVLIVGNFLSRQLHTRGVCEDLAVRLTGAGWLVRTTSDRVRPLRRLGDILATIWRTRHEYAVAQVDVYSGRAFLWAEAACWLLRRIGRPFVLTLHGGNLPAYSSRWPRRVARLLSKAAKVTTPSPYLLNEMQSYRKDLLLLPNPIDLSAYSFRLRERLAPRLVWVRAFHAIYNPTLAVRVTALLAQEFPDVRLTMVGPDKGDRSLAASQAAAREFGVSDRITFAGGVAKSQVPTYLAGGDIFLNTSNLDNTPVSVLEPMASGLPVVSTAVGGLSHLLADERDALLVPSDDPPRMAAAIRRLVTDPALARRLAVNARSRVESFDWTVVLPQWEKLLTAVIGGRS